MYVPAPWNTWVNVLPSGALTVALVKVASVPVPPSTPAQSAAAKKIESDLTPAITIWEKFLKTDLPALNASLRQAGLPELDPERKARGAESQGNAE